MYPENAHKGNHNRKMILYALVYLVPNVYIRLHNSLSNRSKRPTYTKVLSTV